MKLGMLFANKSIKLFSVELATLCAAICIWNCYVSIDKRWNQDFSNCSCWHISFKVSKEIATVICCCFSMKMCNKKIRLLHALALSIILYTRRTVKVQTLEMGCYWIIVGIFSVDYIMKDDAVRETIKQEIGPSENFFQRKETKESMHPALSSMLLLTILPILMLVKLYKYFHNEYVFLN